MGNVVAFVARDAVERIRRAQLEVKAAEAMLVAEYQRLQEEWDANVASSVPIPESYADEIAKDMREIQDLLMAEDIKWGYGEKKTERPVVTRHQRLAAEFEAELPKAIAREVWTLEEAKRCYLVGLRLLREEEPRVYHEIMAELTSDGQVIN